MTVKNAMQFVELCENTLGWVPDSSKPLLTARRIMAGRLKQAIAKDPGKLTWHNLELAVEMLRRRRQPITSPVYVIYKVDEALEMAHAPAPARPLGDLMEKALAVEMALDTDESRYWVGRLVRAQGDARREVYDEWHAERGQS